MYGVCVEQALLGATNLPSVPLNPCEGLAPRAAGGKELLQHEGRFCSPV